MRRSLSWMAGGGLLGGVIGAGGLLTLVWSGASRTTTVLTFATPTAGTTGAPAPVPSPPPPPTVAPSAGATAAPEPTTSPSPVEPRQTPVIGPAQRVVVKGTGDDGLNVRAEPSGASERVKVLPEGAELEVVGADREVDGTTWRNVRDPSDGTSGWAVAEFLSPLAD